MARPASGYRTADGIRQPGVTTVCGCLGEKDGMIHAAWKLGMDGKNYREEWGKKMHSGSVSHELIDAHLNHRAPELGEYDEEIVVRGRKGFDSYLEWEAQVKLEVIATEESMVSERLRCGGTFDAMGMVETREGKKLALIDFKTGALYPEHVAQLGGYDLIWNELHPGDPIERWYLLRLNKETGSFSFYGYTEEVIDVGRRAFIKARELYDVKAELAKVAK